MKWSRFICFAQFYRRIGPDYCGGNGGTLGHSSGWFPVQPNCLWSPLWPAQHVLVLVVRLVHCYLSIARGRFYCWVDNCVMYLACPGIQFIRWIQNIWDNEYIFHSRYAWYHQRRFMFICSCCCVDNVYCRHLSSCWLFSSSACLDCCFFSLMQVIK